ncbi:hypothetical protein Tco_1365143, partial [Tanacetum coccineum]
MSNNNAGTGSDVESKCTPVDDIESNQAMSDKAAPGKVENTDIQSKHVMFPKVQQTNVELFLDQLQVDVTEKIIVMIGRKWDVSSVTGRYLSMDFVVSDAK